MAPRHARLIASDMLGRAEQPVRPHRDHLTAAIDWLCRAQDVRNGQPDAGGVSAGWSFEDGWLPSYPETSGYIVETFLAASKALGRPTSSRARIASRLGAVDTASGRRVSRAFRRSPAAGR
jgi:hypothetical protein